MSKSVVYKNILDNIYDGVYFVDKERKILYWNEGAKTLSGYSNQEMIGKYCYDNILNHIDDEGNRLCIIGCPLKATIEDQKERVADVYLRHKDGHRVSIRVKIMPVYDDDGNHIGAVEIFHDNSKEKYLEKNVKNLENIVIYDSLTGAFSRSYAEKTIKIRLNEINRYKTEFVLAFIDLDNFKYVNDTFGHKAGDDILKMVSSTFIENIRKNDVFARWGGDEMLLILSEVGKEEAYAILEKFRQLILNSSINVGGNEAKVTLSIGATIANAKDSYKKIVKRADELMYSAKKNGKNQIIFE